MKLSNEGIRILNDLYRAVDGLSPYIFFQRYRMSPSVVFDFVQKFTSNGYVETENDSGRITITKIGKDFVLKNKFNISSDKFYNIPEGAAQPGIKINELYLPNVKKVSKEIFNLH